MFFHRRRAFFRMGILKYVILHSLSKKPMHGYEIISSLDEEFGGFYRPSAGAIYPVLQALEDQGFVTGEEEEGKRVYSVTPKGEEFLKQGEDRVKAFIEKRKEFIKERKSLNKELRNLSSLIMTNYRNLTPENAEKIAQILREARININEVIFE